MAQKIKLITLLSGFILFFLKEKLPAQSFMDVALGTSHQDEFSVDLAYKKQFSAIFRAGAAAQISNVKYRLIDALPISTGFATTFSVPMTWRLHQQDRIGLYAFLRPGVRFQSVIDPDNNDKRDSTLSSTAALADLGLLVSVKVSEKTSFQSGATFPMLFQFAPSALFENFYTLIHFGLTHQTGTKTVLFAKTFLGSAAGGDGDTQKFGWSLAAGFRYNLGQGSKGNMLLVEPNF